MALMDWDAKFNVGLMVIDEQHKRIFSLINSLHDSLIGGQDPSALYPTICELVEQVRAHFESEEGLMEMVKYPGLDGHRAEHDCFLEQLEGIKRSYEEGKTPLDEGLLASLSGRLLTHTQGMDRHFSMGLKP